MMVEETINSVNKPKNKTARPRPVYLWTVVDVQKWLRRHCADYYPLYWEKFQHESCHFPAAVDLKFPRHPIAPSQGPGIMRKQNSKQIEMLDKGPLEAKEVGKNRRAAPWQWYGPGSETPPPRD